MFSRISCYSVVFWQKKKKKEAKNNKYSWGAATAPAPLQQRYHLHASAAFFSQIKTGPLGLQGRALSHHGANHSQDTSQWQIYCAIRTPPPAALIPLPPHVEVIKYQPGVDHEKGLCVCVCVWERSIKSLWCGSMGGVGYQTRVQRSPLPAASLLYIRLVFPLTNTRHLPASLCNYHHF